MKWAISSLLQVVRSIKRYPLPLQSGTEARILEGCGEKIAKMLDKKLAKLRSNSTDSEYICTYECQQ